VNTFLLKIITPEKIFFSAKVQKLILRTTEGDIGILAKHEKYVAMLPSGPIRLIDEDGKERYAAVSGGVLRVAPEETAVLANAVEWAEDIDIDWAKRSEEDARRRLKQSKTQHEMDRAQAKLDRALNRLRVSSLQK